MKTRALVAFLDELLNIKDISDTSQNGLQIENSGDVKKIGLAVDASAASFQKAKELNVDFLLVHHGIFWDKPMTLTGVLYQRVKILMDADIALYGAHLPLDMHPELGNNAQVQKVLGWPVVGDFGDFHGNILGKAIRFDKPVILLEIAEQLAEKLHCEPLIWDFGPNTIQYMGYVSGGGIKMLEQAIDARMDLYITGEPSHSIYWEAREAGINVILAGHYATETLGVKAVGERIRETFKLDVVFIDLPTGF
jgi:dinuclear metal center YbgI/SA1388 family protein